MGTPGKGVGKNGADKKGGSDGKTDRQVLHESSVVGRQVRVKSRVLEQAGWVETGEVLRRRGNQMPVRGWESGRLHLIKQDGRRVGASQVWPRCLPARQRQDNGLS